MATLYKLKISNFRGIKNLEHTFNKKLSCFIGHGDSGKTSLLDAISLVLSPHYTSIFDDGDFYRCDVSNPIEIEATLIDVPDTITNKYDTHLRGIYNGKIIDDMESEEAPNAELAITIRLTVTKNLEPLWEVVTGRGQEPRSISAYDRSQFNMFTINEFTDRHFNFNKGNPLYKLLNQTQSEKTTTQSDVIFDTLRSTKEIIDESLKGKFDEIIKKIVAIAKVLGIDISVIKTAFDMKDIMIKENKVSLHEEDIPLRLRGKGSKRLISLAIQLSIVSEPSIILIDEIEIGLESFRVQHLVRVLKKEYPDHQIIFTTHSRDVVVELDCENIFIIRKDAEEIYNLPGLFQDMVRKNPEALFAKRIILCEGKTEIGLCRAYNEYREKKQKESFACLGISIAYGSGDEMKNYILKFRKLKFDVCLICDSDNNIFNDKKASIIDSGAAIYNCEPGNSIEAQIFKDVSFGTIKNIINYVIENEIVQSISLIQSINSNINENKVTTIESLLSEDRIDIRNALGKSSNNKSWFKNITKGTAIGELIFNDYDSLESDVGLRQIFDGLTLWIENN